MWEVKLKVVSVCTYISLLLGAILWHLVIIQNIKYSVVFVRYKKKENVRPLPSYLLPIPTAKWKCLVQFTAAMLQCVSLFIIYKDNYVLQRSS